MQAPQARGLSTPERMTACSALKRGAAKLFVLRRGPRLQRVAKDVRTFRSAIGRWSFGAEGCGLQ